MAIAGVDYIDFSRTIQLTTAELEVGQLCFSVAIINDDLVEYVECFTVQFLLGDSSISGLVIYNDVLMNCIEDDDSKYTYSPSLCPLSSSRFPTPYPSSSPFYG